MRCYICNRETSNFKRDPDGKITCICSVCRKYIYDCNRTYQDITDDDVKILKMTKKDFIKAMKEDVKDVSERNTQSKDKT